LEKNPASEEKKNLRRHRDDKNSRREPVVIQERKQKESCVAQKNFGGILNFVTGERRFKIKGPQTKGKKKNKPPAETNPQRPGMFV